MEEGRGGRRLENGEEKEWEVNANHFLNICPLPCLLSLLAFFLSAVGRSGHRSNGHDVGGARTQLVSSAEVMRRAVAMARKRRMARRWCQKAIVLKPFEFLKRYLNNYRVTFFTPRPTY